MPEKQQFRDSQVLAIICLIGGIGVFYWFDLEYRQSYTSAVDVLWWVGGFVVCTVGMALSDSQQITTIAATLVVSRLALIIIAIGERHSPGLAVLVLVTTIPVMLYLPLRKKYKPRAPNN